MTPKKPARFLGIVFLVASAALIMPFIIGEFRLSANTNLFNFNLRSLYFFFRFYDPELFRHDYTADYFLRMWTPPGFLALQYGWAQIADPALLHRFMSPVLWLACAPLVFFSAKRLGGLANAFATLGIYLCSSVFLFRMAAGVSHSFGFPLCWWIVSALVSGRSKSLAAATITSAAIYPFMLPVAGLTLAFWLLFPRFAPATHTAPELHWKWPHKLFFLAATAFVALLFMGPMLISHFNTDYGQLIHVLQENDSFPESSPEGRNTIFTTQSQPLGYLLLMILYQNATRLGAIGSIIITFSGLAVLLGGVLLHDARDRRPGSLTPFMYAAGICFLSSLITSYRMAYHFAIYPGPVLLTLFLPLALRRFSRIFPVGMRGAVFAFSVLGYMSCIAAAQPDASGYSYKLEGFQTRTLAFVRTLPKEAVFAGWPGDDYGKIAENIPYFARRQTLVTWESHAAMHTGYVLVMRERMNALIDAYLARDKAPLRTLRDKFHVDYLVVNEADLTGDKPPRYFEPFNQRARELWEKNRESFVVLKLAKTISVYSQDGIYILDLKKL